MAQAVSIDRGWAWAVLVGVHVSSILTMGYISTLGVFYIEWKEYFQTNATATSWLVSLPPLVASPLSFFVGILASLVGVRRVAMAGAAVNGVAAILGSFTTDIRQLYVCTAVTGVGVVMVIAPGSIILSDYFKKRYAFANGVAAVGISVGQMLFPPLIRVLTTSYGWRDAMFIIGAVHLNGVAACALFRPLKDLSDKEPPLSERNPQNVESCVRDSADCNIEVANSSPPGQTQPKRVQSCSGILKVFTNVPMMLNLLSCGFFAMAAIINVTHLPARSKEAGWSDDQSAMLLFVLAVFSLGSRLSNGWFVDRGFISSFRLQLGTLLGGAVTTFLNPVSDSYVFLVVYAGFVGTSIGTSAPLFIVNSRHLVSQAEVPVALSLVWATILFSGGTGTVIAGKIFDVTGNYVTPFLCAGAMFLVAFLLLAIVTILKTRRDKNQKLGTSHNNVQYQQAADEHAEQS